MPLTSVIEGILLRDQRIYPNELLTIPARFEKINKNEQKQGKKVEPGGRIVIFGPIMRVGGIKNSFILSKIRGNRPASIEKCPRLDALCSADITRMFCGPGAGGRSP